jgi:hypothetical protein
VPTLLMVYVTLTQDADYLEQFAPQLAWLRMRPDTV